MFYKSKKNQDKKNVYATRKYRKRLVSGIIAAFIILGSVAVTNIMSVENAYAIVNINDTTSKERFEKIGHAYWKWVAVDDFKNRQEAADAGANIEVQPQSDGTIDVTLTYNSVGVYDADYGYYIRTSDPWYSFALSSGYDIVSNKVYAVDVNSTRYSVPATDAVPKSNIFIDSYTGNGYGYYNQTHVGIKDLDSDAKANYYRDLSDQKIDINKLGYFELFKYESDNKKDAFTTVVFKIKPNSNFEAGKEFIVANYKSYDNSKLYVANNIVKDTEIRKDYKLYIEPAKDSLKLGKDLVFNFETSDKKNQTINLNDTTKESEEIIFNKLLESEYDTTYPFSNFRLSVDGKTTNVDGQFIITKDGKSYDVFLGKKENVNINGEIESITLEYEIKEHSDRGQTGYRFTRIFLDEAKNATVMKSFIKPEKL